VPETVLPSPPVAPDVMPRMSALLTPVTVSVRVPVTPFVADSVVLWTPRVADVVVVLNPSVRFLTGLPLATCRT
jgi:hypothetical protein